MAYPSLTFANLLDNATRAELEQLISLLQGYLSVEHHEDGSHGDVTADSLVVSGDVSIEGDLIGDGDASFDGNVTADADGSPAILGNFGGGFGSGIDALDGTHSRWQITAVDGTSPTRRLQFRDVLNGSQTYAFQLGSYTGGTGVINYSVVPESVTGLSLGENSIGKRIDEVNCKTLLANTQLFERGRSAAIGEWTTFTPSGVVSNGTGTVSAVSAGSSYARVGTSLIVSVNFTYTMAGAGGGDTVISFTVPGGLTAVRQQVGSIRIVDAGAATDTAGLVFSAASSTLLGVAKAGLVAFGNAAGNSIQGTFIVETTA